MISLLVIILIVAISIRLIYTVGKMSNYEFNISTFTCILNFLTNRVMVAIYIIFSFYFLFYNYSDYSHCTINRNIFTGEVTIDTIPGHNITWPWVQVSSVDLRPQRVPILSGARTYNYKLVKFNPKYYKEFVEAEGFRYYWLANRFSYNFGHDYESRGIFDILRGYAYDSKEWNFITIDKEE